VKKIKFGGPGKPKIPGNPPQPMAEKKKKKNVRQGGKKGARHPSGPGTPPASEPGAKDAKKGGKKKKSKKKTKRGEHNGGLHRGKKGGVGVQHANQAKKPRFREGQRKSGGGKTRTRKKKKWFPPKTPVPHKKPFRPKAFLGDLTQKARRGKNPQRWQKNIRGANTHRRGGPGKGEGELRW